MDERVTSGSHRGQALNIKFSNFRVFRHWRLGYDVGEGKCDVAQVAGQILTEYAATNPKLNI